MAPKRSENHKTDSRLSYFQALSIEAIERWVGQGALRRAQSYERRGAVRELGVLENDQLLARVYGSRRYVTWVGVDEDREIMSQCTCPVVVDCKHAAAAVLEAAKRVGGGERIPAIDREGELYVDYVEQVESVAVLVSEMGLEDDADHGDRLPSSPSRADAAIDAFLESLPVAKLKSMLLELAEAYPDVRKKLEDWRNVGSRDQAACLKTLKREVQLLSEGDYRYRDGGCWEADPLRIARRVKTLLKMGAFDELVALGDKLLQAGAACAEADREGDLLVELGDAFTLLLDALEGSSLSPPQQLRTAVRWALNDDYSLVDSAVAERVSKIQDKSAWRELAVHLSPRLDRHQAETDIIARLRRDRISDWILRAYDEIGDTEAGNRLAAREAPITCSHARLVRRLVDQKLFREAEKACIEGIEHCENAAGMPGLVSRLRNDLKEIWRMVGAPKDAVALLADEFFMRPDFCTYHELIGASEACGCGPDVKRWAREFLKTGHTPHSASSRVSSDDLPEWPLPSPPVLATRSSQLHRGGPPYFDTLIQIAIEERDPDAVLKWWTQWGKRGQGFYGYGISRDQVANALREAHPEVALGIWQSRVSENIGRVSPSGYDSAAPYLKRIKRLLSSAQQGDRWRHYLAELREINRRRPRCMEMLDRVEGGKD